MVKLFQHQQESLDQTEGLNRVAYYLDMGLGKTFVGAEKMIRIDTKVNLVICQHSKIQDWIDHFEQHYKVPVYNLTKAKKLNEFCGKASSERNTVIGVINYELAWRRKDLLNLKDFTLMLDESSLIQNRTAKQTKFILKLNPENVILLSGTPTAGKYENLWTQAHLLGWKISQDLFNKQYVNYDTIYVGRMPHKVVNKSDPYKNIERLKAKFREHGAVFLKTEECFDLPDQNFIEVKVSKTKEYTKFKKDSIVTLKDGTELVGDTSLTKRLYSRQLCGQYNKEKFEAFRDLVQSTNDRLIVFYNFNDELYKMVNCLDGERPVSIINGTSKMLANYEKFDNTIVFVQYQAGAMGLNLQKANKIIYFTPPERCELWMQSQKRIHRIGQEKPCYYYKLICPGSVEEDIYSALERGVDYTDDLFRDFQAEKNA